MDSNAIFVRHSNHSMTSTFRPERKIFLGNVEQHITYRQIFILPLIVIALLGNSAIILTNFKRFILKKMNDSDFIGTQLAICDILRAIFFCLVYLRNQWKESDVSCIAIQKFLLLLFSICNMLTLVLTYLRYRVIRYPFFRTKNRIWKQQIVLLLIWIGHIAVFAQTDLFEFVKHETGKFSFCQSKPVQSLSHSPALIAEIIILSLLSLLSVVTITILLTLIFKRLKEPKTRNLSVSSTNIQKRNQRSVKILVSMYIAYVTSLIPWILIYVLNSLETETFNRIVLQTWFIIVLWFIAGSFCNTFLTLMLYSKKFKKELKSIFFFKEKHDSSYKLTGFRVTAMKDKKWVIHYDSYEILW